MVIIGTGDILFIIHADHRCTVREILAGVVEENMSYEADGVHRLVVVKRVDIALTVTGQGETFSRGIYSELSADRRTVQVDINSSFVF